FSFIAPMVLVCCWELVERVVGIMWSGGVGQEWRRVVLRRMAGKGVIG
nr:hypothetical protein [Tanacetum cinerariifolium]